MTGNGRIALWSAALASLPCAALAQAVPYEITVETAAYNPLAGPNVTTYAPVAYVLGFNAWDEGYATIPLPFPFSWFGRTYSTIYVYTNGFLSFDPPPAGTLNILAAPSAVPDPRNPVHNFIAPLWQDLEGGTAPAIRAVTGGAAPNRRIVIEVTGLRRARTPTSQVGFQVRLEENGSVIISYDPNQNNGVTLATVAIEDAQGVLGGNLLAPSASCAGGCSCGARGCSSTNVTISHPTDTRAITLRPPMAAELIGTVRGPAGAYPGNAFSAGVRVSNVGFGNAAATQAELRLSLDAVIDGSDRLLTTVSIPALAGGASFSSTVATTMPAGLPVERYFLGLVVDATRVVTEPVESNNTAYDPQGIVTGPDLTATVVAPIASGPGETLDLTFALRSRGAPWTTPVAVTFFLSEDAQLDPNDRELLSTSYTLPDGFALDRTVSIVVPNDVTPRAYRVIASVDPLDVVDEIDEGNNVAVSPGSVTMSLPDVEPIELVSGPAAFRGLPYPIRARVTNRGGSTARNFTVCAVISRNPLISTVSDPILATTPPMTLAGGEGASIRLEPIIPVSTGTGAWFLALVADCAESVGEANEPNNTRRRMDPITVLDPVPDLVPIAITTSSAAAAGEPLLTSVTIGNHGPAAGAARIRLVLTGNATAMPTDRVIYDGMMAVPLEPGREVVLGLSADLPGDIGSGRYFVGVILDPLGDVAEVDDTNNILTSGPMIVLGSNLSIVSPPPPNGIDGVRYTWRFFAVGGDSSQPLVWSATWRDGMAPGGLTFDPATAELAGTPAGTGMFTLDLEVRRGTLVARASYPLVITPPTLPLSIVSGRLPPAIQQEPYNVRLVAVGGTPPYTWSPAPGTRLPASLMLEPDGQLHGNATVAGAYTFTVEVRDALGTLESGDVALDVVDLGAGISITTTDLPSGAVGEAYDIPLSVMGGTEPYTWRYDGEIPGITLDANAHLVGTPTVAGSYPITIEVRDSRGLLDRNAYVVRIFELGELAILTGRSADSQLPRGTVGQPYASGDGNPVTLRAGRRSGAEVVGLEWMVVLGELPPGVILDSATGTIQGTPTQPGAFAFTVLAFDDSADRDRATLVIVVDPPGGVVVPEPPDGCGCSTTGEPRAPLGLAAGVVLLGLFLRRRRAALAAGAIALGSMAPMSAEAQPIPYTVVREQVPYVPLTNGTRIVPELGDGSTARLALPFDLRLYGQTYRELYINANGVVFVAPAGPGQHFPPRVVPDIGQPNGFIAGLWGDWCSGSSLTCGGPPGAPDAGIYTRIDATPGAGRVTVEYRSLRHFADFVAPSDITFQITLYEGPAEQIDIHYGTLIPGESFGGQPTFLTARVGLESADGRTGTWLAPCDGPSACENDEIVSLNQTRLRLLADAGEDVAVASLIAPPVVYPGLAATVTVRYVSRHGQPLGPARLAAYLVAPSDTSTTGGELLATTPPITLAPYESRAIQLELPIPANLPPGRRAIAIVADAEGALAETDENNNLSISGPLRVSDRAPDLAIADVRPLDAQVQPGQPLRVAYRVANLGNEPARGSARLYLSSNEAVTTADPTLGAAIALDLAPGAAATGTASVMLPASASGAQWVGMIADPEGMLLELDETNNVGRAPEPVVIAGQGIVFVTQDLPPATLTASYQARIIAAGGERAPTLRLTRGMLPRGLSFAADRGELFGVPLETGEFELEIEAASGADTALRALVLTVVTPDVPLSIVTRDLPDAVLGSDYATTVRVIGGTRPYGWRVIGSLPPGIDLATDGTLLGSPRASGTYPFGLEVRDNAAHTATIGFSLDVRPPGNLTALDATLPGAQVGEPYSFRVTALGGTPPYRWTAQRALPPGFELTELGEIIGTPTEVGTFPIALRVEDAAASTDTNAYVVEVAPKGRLAIIVARHDRATIGQPYRAVLRVEGGVRPYTWQVVEQEGALPPGIAAGPGEASQNESTNDLALAGVIAEPGVWAFTVRLRDAQGLVVERALAIEAVSPPPPPPPEESGCRCVAARSDRSTLAALGLLAAAAVIGRRRARPDQESSC